jgi:hypothetical protein
MVVVLTISYAIGEYSAVLRRKDNEWYSQKPSEISGT